MIVYGRNPVREALRGPRDVKRIWATKNAAREPWLGSTTSNLTVAAADLLARQCGTDAHQGICAEVGPFPYASAETFLQAPEPLIVALDQVQDPQNLGAICRTAECGGVTGLVIGERRSAEVTPAVCKASAGAVEHLAIAKVRNVADFVNEAKRYGIWCYATDAAASVSLQEVELSGGIVIVLGSEGRGVRPRVAAACDATVSIPMRGRTESLSVSAAAAILIYAALAARGSNPGSRS